MMRKPVRRLMRRVFHVHVEEFNVRDFGAVGDGETDDTAAIQAALNAASEYQHPRQWWNPRTWYWKVEAKFPAGTWRVSSTLEVGSGTNITGA